MTRQSRSASLPITILASVFATLGCSPDIFDVSVALAPEMFPVDFGATTGTIPTVACDPQSPAPCGGDLSVDFTDGNGQATVKPGCDAATARCFAQADARYTYAVNVLQDDNFTSAVGRHTVSLVRMVDIAITIPANTMTFDIPEIDLYVGPPGSLQPSDPGVVSVDSVRSISAGTTIAAPGARHLVVADGSPARDLIEGSIKNKTPFVFVLTLAPRLESGAVLPAGALEVDIQPLVGLGLR